MIGTQARDVAEEDALDHIAGYLLLNDLSARDRQFATPQWIPGKVFDGAAPCGPRLVPPEDAGPPGEIGIELRLNGELRQSATTADLVHSIPALVAHLSSLMTLVPGDLVATGTPAGVGSLRNPRSYLRPGDETVISSPQLGELTHAHLRLSGSALDVDLAADRLGQQLGAAPGRPQRHARVAAADARVQHDLAVRERSRRRLAPTGRGFAPAARPGG